MSRRMLLAAERIADEPAFAARFRSDPAAAVRRYRLDHDQVAALKDGSIEALSSHGIDVIAFADGRRHGPRSHLRRAVAVVAMAAGLFGLSGSPAAAARRAPRHGLIRARTTSVRKVSTALREQSSVRYGLRTAVRHQGVPGLGRAGLSAGLRANGVVVVDCGLKCGPFPLGD